MLIPNWLTPKTIRAVCFDKHDNDATIQAYLPNSPCLLKQVHGHHVLKAPFNDGMIADGCYSKTPLTICAIKTADCLPIYLTSQDGAEIALLHGGWRGLSQNIIAQGVTCFSNPPQAIIAYLGPAISAPCYEISQAVYDAFCQVNPTLQNAFTLSRPYHYYANLVQIAHTQLQQQGVTIIYGGDLCTFSEPERFYSYRRDAQNPGRLLHCLWIDP